MNPKTLKTFSVIIMTSMALVLFPLSSKGYAIEVWVCNPWFSMLARFLGGAQTKVNPLLVWAENSVVKPGRSGLTEGSVVLAVNNDEAVRVLGKKNLKRYSLHFLFESFLTSGGRVDENFMDPAALPFIGLRTLEILSAADPGNYDYFQRRLAEFQARLDSTVVVGRNMIGDSTILDLSWIYGRWIQAAAGKVIRPPDLVKAGWSQGADLDVLDTALEEARKQNWLIVVDPWTPAHIREMSNKIPGFIELPAPRMEGDMILFLYDLYLQIWDYTRKNITIHQ
ncbi:MAG: hypothetical protein RQ767_00750 [Thermovirgaceae bacterium]|nr:hypothetical protein [Thermovirgaceae bacterium]